jgi:hypothetical protein
MNIETLTNEMAELFRSNLVEFFEKEETASLTESLSMKMMKQTRDLMYSIGTRTLEQFFESYDIKDETIERDGVLYRLKYRSQREFITSLGKRHINRNVYQKDRRGMATVPLDILSRL